MRSGKLLRRGDIPIVSARVHGCVSARRYPSRQPKAVAAELQMSVAAVYLAKGRVLQRIKEQLQLLNGEC